MQRSHALLKMFGRMTVYGIVLGAIAGFLVGITILLTMSGSSLSQILSEIFGIIMLSAVYGGMFGGIYGGVSGFFSGLGMALVTAVAYGEISDVKRYQLVMGVITAMVTSGVFVVGGLVAFGSGIELTWLSAMVMSVVIAVYASQMASRKYVKDVIFREEKAKA